MRPRTVVGAALTLIAAGILLVMAPRGGPPSPPATAATTEHPKLLLLTGLPLVFGEKFELGGGSAALARLEQDFVVEPIAATERGLLDRGGLLLMAQPRAQPAEQLVELDQWVRRGGRVLLLADPALRWPSEKELGDVTRAPVQFADTGLLAHWGLRLYGPDPDGPAMRAINGLAVMSASPGRLTALPGARCRLGDDGFVARCAIGKGTVVVIADADFLNVAGDAALDGPTEQNLAALVGTLESLATH